VVTTTEQPRDIRGRFTARPTITPSVPIIYYEDDLVTLYHGDCRDSDAWLAADVLICDPPYGIDYRSGMRSETIARSIANDTDTTVREDILARWGNRPALVFGARRIPEPAGVKMFLVWDKGGALGMGDVRIPWKPGHEEIYVLGPTTHWTGPRTNDVLSYPPVQSIARNGRKHPHQKPVPLLCDLVGKTLGVIADPTTGSGSLLVAAKRMGRRAIGFETDEKHCATAAERLRAEVTLTGFYVEDSTPPAMFEVES
jgi:site-specific DNA-methyltransferase (adenine-specific)